jgi:adenylosuccinate synthase
MRDKLGEQIGWITDEFSFYVRDTNTGRNRRKKLYNTHLNIYITRLNAASAVCLIQIDK